MLNFEGQEEYLNEVRTFADKVGKRLDLERNLDRLRDLYNHDGEAVCYVGKDFAPYSFRFSVFRPDKDGEQKFVLNGGLIFHGDHDNGGDGGAPTLSVCLTPQDGWSIHT